MIGSDNCMETVEGLLEVLEVPDVLMGVLEVLLHTRDRSQTTLWRP